MTDNQAEAKAETALVQLKLRFQERTRAKLEVAAKSNGSSLNSEIVNRLERSLDQDDQNGGLRTSMLLSVVAAEIGRAETFTGQAWSDDLATYAAMRLLVSRVIVGYQPRTRGMDKAVEIATEIERVSAELPAQKDSLLNNNVIEFSNNFTPDRHNMNLMFSIRPEQDWDLGRYSIDLLRGRVKMIEELRERIISLKSDMAEALQPEKEAQQRGQAIFQVLCMTESL